MSGRKPGLLAWRLTGVATAALAWIVIALAASRNPWFDVFRHALSDLGGPRATDPWVFNAGLIAAGALTCVYALYLTHASASKALTFASALVFVAGIFLALIGVFPSRTYPHVFVSVWFFVQMWMAMVAAAVDFLVRRELAPGAVLLGLSVVGPVGALAIEWPSVALLEIYGIVIIDALVVLMTLRY